jgi:hypothetical protein
MNSHIEKENILTFGRRSIDVSNVSYGRIVKASTMWNNTIQEENITAEQVNKMSEKVGLYLIRQDFNVLLFRFTFIKSVKEYVKRLFLTVKHINKSNKEEYECFQDWVYFMLTGKKKDHLEAQKDIMGDMAIMYQKLKSQGVSLDQCLELLQTLAPEQVKA